MNEKTVRERYSVGKGCFLTHTSGMGMQDTTLPFLHRNDECAFFYFKRGSGSIQIEGRRYDIHEGDIFMINPSELFLCRVDENCYHERITLRVNRELLRGFDMPEDTLLSYFYRREKGGGNYIPARVMAEHRLGMYFEEILSLVTSPSPVQNLLAVCRVIELLAKIQDIGEIASGQMPDGKNMNPLISSVVVYIHQHFREELTIAQIAQAFHVDASYLSHLFRRETGMTLWNYVITCRINYFNRMLHQKRTIEEACSLAGFKNYSNFYRLYQKHMGMTPSEFRRAIEW